MTATTLRHRAPARAQRPHRPGAEWGSPGRPTSSPCVVIALASGRCSTSSSAGSATNSQITVDPAGLPEPVALQQLLDVLTGSTFWQEIGNSVIVAVVTTVGVVVLGLMASYVLARYKFRGRGRMYALFAAGLMFPMTVAITPLYILVKDLGLMNNLGGRHPAADRVRAADDDHHPGAVPAGDPGRARGGRRDRRCSRLGFFWRMVHAAVAARGGDRRASWRSSAAGTATCCRCSSSTTRRRSRCRSACRRSRRSTPSTPRRCSRSPRCR